MLILRVLNLRINTTLRASFAIILAVVMGGIGPMAGFTQSGAVEKQLQHADEGSELSRHRIMAVLGHTHVPQGVNEEGKKAWLVLGSFGLDYDFRINSRWSIGLHSDLVLERFGIEEHDDVVVERSSPLLATLCVSRRVGGHLSLLAGAGMEFAKEANLAVVRVGGDYGWELPGEWEVALSLMWDVKISEYDAWVFGVGIGKAF